MEEEEKEEKKKKHANMAPTPAFQKRTDEAESELASAVGTRKKPKTGPVTGSSPKGTVTVGTVKTYTNREAAKEAVDQDKKERAAAKAKEEKSE